MKVLTVLTLALIAATPCWSQGVDRGPDRAWYLNLYFGHTENRFGGEEKRVDRGFGIAYAKPEPSFRWGSNPGKLLMEFMYLHSDSRGIGTDPPNVADMYAFFASSRVQFAPRGGLGAYIDPGLGILYVDRQTHDLSSKLNTVPSLGLGLYFRPRNGGEYGLGLRYLHISNSGFVAHNRGVNNLMLSLSYRF